MKSRAGIKKFIQKMTVGVMLTGMMLVAAWPASTYAQERVSYQDYVSILYNSENGMPTSEANDVVQTSDGFIWIASYSGLIRFDGDTFERISDADGVASANTLFTDSKDRLWIGTNDNGLMLYELGKYTTYNKEHGLSSNSVKTIEEDSRGNLYVGTTGGICYLDTETGVINQIPLEEGADSYINSMCILPDDTLIAVTNTGKVYQVQNQTCSSMELAGMDQSEIFTSVNVVQDGWMLGTEGSSIYRCTGTADSFQFIRLDTRELKRINCVESLEDGTLWICSDTGVGYFDQNMKYVQLKENQLNNSVDNMIQDYEGNLWFSSSRQGVFKCTRNYFSDLSEKAGLGDTVVNSIVQYNNQTYVATDTGLVVLNSNGAKVDTPLTDYLDGIRIRCLLVDSNRKLWLCCYGEKGLVSFDTVEIKNVGVAQGLDASKLRSAIESRDGSIIVATSNGIYYVKDGQVTDYLGSEEGLTNMEILSLYEAEDGTLYAGTDGGGVCMITDGKVTGVISEEQGLRSGIVMRIRYDEKRDGLWLITSNSIAFYKDGKAETIEKFPYSNNYDLYFGDDDTLWILSSDGLYVVHGDSMFGNAALRYSFYNYNTGMPSTPTSNAFSYMDSREDILYICGSKGIYSIQMSLVAENTVTKLAIPYITVDGELVWNRGAVMDIPSDAKRIQIDAFALSYGLENPLISYELKGFDDEKMVVRKSEMSDITYTNLRGGDYTFHFSVVDPNTNEELATQEILLHKDYQMMEQPWFFPVVAFVTALLVAVIVYVVSKFRMNHYIIQQEEAQKKVLADALQQAESASMAKGSFLSNMSHEIRTPLNAVIGYLSIAKDSDRNLEKIMHCIDNSEIAAKHLLQIINDVLDMSSIESGKMKIANEEFDLKKEISDITTIFYQNCKNKGVEFNSHIEGLTQEWVTGDQLRLNQILMNLLSNSVKFTPEQGHVTLLVKQLSMDEKSVYVQFVVSDTGIGMSEEYKQRLFQPFEQENASTAKKYGGSGLGLSITNNLISMMGGTITVDSKQNEGTTFTVTMHFDRAATQTGQQPSPAEYAKIRVLIVDDQENEGTYIKSVLKNCGVKADAVTSGELALKRIRSRMGGDYAYDLCILDWKMPDMNGLEVAEKIRAEFGSELPIIVATAYDVSEFEDEAKKAGVNKVVSKPLFQSTLFDLLVTTFGKYDPEKQKEEKKVIDMSGVRVILAEDNEMNMDIAVTVLEKAGVQVDQAVNGEEACSLFLHAPEHTYDLILMDIQMPVMNGYEATRKIRGSAHPDAETIPVIAMTANAFAEDVAEALANGMNAHIAKPINYDKLFELLKQFS